MSVKRDCLAD